MNRRFQTERDACAIVAIVDKRGRATHANIVKTIDALKAMGHRSGDINGEGDGCGILIDIPRAIWARRLEEKGVSPHVAYSPNFFVGHFLITYGMKADEEAIRAKIAEVISSSGAQVLIAMTGAQRVEELGPRARAEAPIFFQVAGVIPGADQRECQKKLFELHMAIEAELPDLHIASLSTDSVVYKLRGMPQLLPRVYPEILDESNKSVCALGHSRYSTNTLPTVERAQPFSVLGHNGEINTIERLRSTGKTMGIEPVPGGSDSQDLNRIIEGLINIYGFDPLEALEMVFPAIHSEVTHLRPELHGVYDYLRWFFPCSAQGPAAVVARFGNICMGSVDALGLRPLWFIESDYDYVLSSEKGIVDINHTLNDPRPLAPGEKIAIISSPGNRAEVLDYPAIQERLLRLFNNKKRTKDLLKFFHKGVPVHTKKEQAQGKKEVSEAQPRLNELAAYGWQHFDWDLRKRVALEGRDIIGSMGHQETYPVFVPESLPNCSEYFKENVAVVTNPAIDREREAEHFTTRCILGSRPGAKTRKGERPPLGLELKNPLLLGGDPSIGCSVEAQTEIANSFGTALYEDVISFFTSDGMDQSRVHFIDATYSLDEDLRTVLDTLVDEAEEKVLDGAILLVVDDKRAFENNRVYIDPGLVVAALIKRFEEAGLKRSTSILVRSGAIRNLHDIMFILGLGADALNPYMLWRVVTGFTSETVDSAQALRNTMDVFQKGMEKVMSTMGIHELCGYGRIFGAVGLKRELGEIFQVPNFCESDTTGVGFDTLELIGKMRYERFHQEEELPLYKEPNRNSKVGRILRNVAVGKRGFKELLDELEKIEEEHPIGLRHCLRPRLAPEEKRLTLKEVDISIKDHDMPLVIAAMSFGSQGENSFRSYAEAALKANIICINGEGGEIPDMLGKYRRNRCQQIASGRFGVYMGLLNSTDYLEIKIGQGAKPGEGGHLPGTKVSERVAEARHCKPGITLISPSNQHDIYSIEDLAQVITELKTANPHAKVSVKIPVTTGVGTIAVGIAKAGADIVDLSGFEGGTGAAREHAKKYVGMPIEVGVNEAHRALVESGLRDSVEIWVDGGLRSPMDVVKMILMGADRVSMGTVALMGVGCISCHRCHLDRCPRGISTQLRSKEDAEKKGVKGFTPRKVEDEAENLARLLKAIGEGVKSILADMGVRSIRDIVGRTELLEQYRFNDLVDAGGVLKKPSFEGLKEDPEGQKIVRRPLNYLTKLISDIAMERFRAGEGFVYYADEGIRSTDRAVGTYLAGAVVREYGLESDKHAFLRLNRSVPGNGLCAFNVRNIDAVVNGGAQDGASKGSFGGLLCILKGRNILGKKVDGSTGKSFAYGAISGTLIVQNYSDSRACVRMSGADVIFGARITGPVDDSMGNIATRAHLKGFAFEYMTGGRAVVLGDPGPWICAGMTGGVIYQCLYPEFNFTKESIERRLARGANVSIKKLSKEGLEDLKELLDIYIRELRNNFQEDEAKEVEALLGEANKRFVMIVPKPVRPPSAG